MVWIWVDDPYETKDVSVKPVESKTPQTWHCHHEIPAGWWWDPCSGWWKNLIQELGSYIIPYPNQPGGFDHCLVDSHEFRNLSKITSPQVSRPLRNKSLHIECLIVMYGPGPHVSPLCLGNETRKKNTRTAHLKQRTSTDLRCGYLFNWHVYIYIYILHVFYVHIMIRHPYTIDNRHLSSIYCSDVVGYPKIMILSVLQNATKTRRLTLKKRWKFLSLQTNLGVLLRTSCQVKQNWQQKPAKNRSQSLAS